MHLISQVRILTFYLQTSVRICSCLQVHEIDLSHSIPVGCFVLYVAICFCSAMESITDKCVNEHDYTLRMEVPLEAIKQEIIEQTVEDASSEDPECVRVPVILRDTKPKLRQPKPPKPRKRKEPKLLPRPDVPIPPPLNSNLGAVPPPNCKGVLVVQDVKVRMIFCVAILDSSQNVILCYSLCFFILLFFSFALCMYQKMVAM